MVDILQTDYQDIAFELCVSNDLVIDHIFQGTVGINHYLFHTVTYNM